ncbi:MAG: hypothetical protein AAFZ07_19670 [Actinomycetota bacterium]
MNDTQPARAPLYLLGAFAALAGLLAVLTFLGGYRDDALDDAFVPRDFLDRLVDGTISAGPWIIAWAIFTAAVLYVPDQ